VARLADVEQRALLSVEAIDSRELRQLIGERRRQVGGDGTSVDDLLESAVDRLTRMPRRKGPPELPQRLRIGQRPMPSVAGEPVPLDHRIQMMLARLAIEPAREPHRANHARGELAADPPELAAQESMIETRVVRDEDAPLEVREHLLRDVLEKRRIAHHLVRDAGELLDHPRNGRGGIDERRPFALERAACRGYEPDLDDARGGGRGTRRLEVHEHDRLVIQRAHCRGILAGETRLLVYDSGPPFKALLRARTMSNTPSLEAFWMPFTANRQFKAKPRILARASGMHYFTSDGRQI